MEFFLKLCVLLCFSVATVTSSVDSSFWQGSLSSGPLFASKHLNVGSKQQSLSEYGSRFAVSGTRLMMAGSGLEMARKPIAPKIIIAGAPAAGKGTQCEIIKKELGVIHLSTGDMLRAAVKDGTELGVKAKEFMDAGQLVPDDLIINVVVERLQQPDCQSKGWLLDGFPRTRAQADAIAALGIVADSFILLDVPQEVLVERVTGRRTDPETGKIYHMKFSPPTDPEITSRLVQRSDDTEEKIVVRYQEFCSHVDSVRECYRDITLWVDGSIAPAEVSEVILSGLGDVVTEADKTAGVGSGATGVSSGMGPALSGDAWSGAPGGIGSSTALRLLRAANSEDSRSTGGRTAGAHSRHIHTRPLGLRQVSRPSSQNTRGFAK